MDVHVHALNCIQTLPHPIVGVQTVSLHQYAPHHVSNVHNKFHSCTVGVQAATMIYNRDINYGYKLDINYGCIN